MYPNPPVTMPSILVSSSDKSISLQVSEVYSGRPHVCMCGCAGKYFADQKNFAQMARKALDVMQANPALVELDKYDQSALWIDLESRRYCVYLAVADAAPVPVIGLPLVPA